MGKYDDLNFTVNARNLLNKAVDDDEYWRNDVDIIYTDLQEKLKFIPFGEYLKRYIYKKACLEEPFESVPPEDYQQIIKESFIDNNTPQSFDRTTAKLGALSKKWLTQQTVRRKVVFLLGFGLRMSADDVNEFLQKGLREQGINAKDPFEVICWYCYNNGYGYLKFESLWQDYCETPPSEGDADSLFLDRTTRVRNEMYAIRSDEDLIAFVSKLKTQDNRTHLSVTARKCFDELFVQAREIVAAIYNEYEQDKYEKEKKRRPRVYTSDDITESDLESVISSAVPVDRHGNLIPSKASKLNARFAGKRFSRQHISEILRGKAEVTRYDLITMNFFIFSQTTDKYPDAKTESDAFEESTNKILAQCYLGELNPSNPYEYFVLSCIHSDSPMGTYADVLELSYEQ